MGFFRDPIEDGAHIYGLSVCETEDLMSVNWAIGHR